MVFIGIDPGKEGGIAAICESGFVTAQMPVLQDGGIYSTMLDRILRSIVDDKIVFLEKSQAAPRQGVSSTFTYGVGFGKIQAVLELSQTAVVFVRPQEWKKRLGLSNQPGKEAAIKFVQEWYPECPLIQKGCRVPHDGIADAMCLAIYGAETYADRGTRRDQKEVRTSP